MKNKIALLFLFVTGVVFGQQYRGAVYMDSVLQGGVEIYADSVFVAMSDANGNFDFSSSATVFQFTYKSLRETIFLDPTIFNEVQLTSAQAENLNEVVVTGTLSPVSRMKSPVPVEVYRGAFLKQTPNANLFEGLQQVNGIRPQVNCAVCNTGDIRINGLPGPYTQILIDGMPIVSALGTVYGLMGIPAAMIDRIEVVRGPAAALYGSESMGGLINVITKDPQNSPRFSFDNFSTTYGEHNLDLGYRIKAGKRGSVLFGANAFYYNEPVDKNNDNFTDLSLQQRISLFSKAQFSFSDRSKLEFAGRYLYEDRWGGDMRWNESFRGGDVIYGESIYTSRLELFGGYKSDFLNGSDLRFSYTSHHQNSVYGSVFYLADQQIAFTQLTKEFVVKKHSLLFGAAYRYQRYNDNTTVTPTADIMHIPSVFVQDLIQFDDKNSLLLGARTDYNSAHGLIFTPRVAYKFELPANQIVRLNAGKGFRVVNLFSEDHAALTGAREVLILEDLKPESSWNATLNYSKKFYLSSGHLLSAEANTWYTYFTNAIIADYDTNPNQVIYKNLNGFSRTAGINLTFDAIFPNKTRVNLGTTFMDVKNRQDGVTRTPVLTESWSGVATISFPVTSKLNLDYTATLVGPMRLPLLGPLDPRPEYSPVYSLQNIQLAFTFAKHFTVIGGVKNMFDFRPDKHTPFLIARANDPFDTNVQTDPQGNILPTPYNPYALSFDPSYIYAQNQGRRFFVGMRYILD